MSQDLAVIVKKCKVLLLDIEGTTTSISFVKDTLFPYAEKNVKEFLESKWETDEVKAAIEGLRKLAIDDKTNAVDGLVDIVGEDASKEEQIESLVKNVQWQMSSDRKSGALKQLQGLIWKQGYESGVIKGHIFDDVSKALLQWRDISEENKIYIYSSGSVQAQKLLFGQSESGDLLKHINGHFDTEIGAKQEVESYKKIIESIDAKADVILFLTDVLKEASAAREAGMNVALVSRTGNAAIDESELKNYIVIKSFEELFSSDEVIAGAGKRKIEQLEEQPAKIAKTEEKIEVTAEDAEKVEETTQNGNKMEVDDAAPAAKKPVEEITVEEVSENIIDTAAVEVEATPIVNEETMEEVTENTKDEKEETTAKPDTVKEKEEDITEIVTEIEEIKDDKIDDEDEVVAEIEPIIDEPEATETDTKSLEEKLLSDLQNVGDELEKECEEILSKVNDVTNLDNIAVKPIIKSTDDEQTENNGQTDEKSDETETKNEKTEETKEKSESNGTSTEENGKSTEENGKETTQEDKVTNGKSEATVEHVNGDSNSKTNGSSENGKEAANDEDVLKNESKTTEVSDIKVKTVSSEETPIDPTPVSEQVVEA